jgi:psp operon transcriptional activator
MALELGRTAMPRFSPAASAELQSYPWPGNVRELKNVVERAVYRSDWESISEVVFDPFVSPYGGAVPAAHDEDRPLSEKRAVAEDLPPLPIQQAVWDLKVRMIENALMRAKYNQRRAATLLGLTYDQFRGLYRRYTAGRPGH